MTIHYLFMTMLDQEERQICKAYIHNEMARQMSSINMAYYLCQKHNKTPIVLNNILNSMRVYDTSITCKGCGRYYPVKLPYHQYVAVGNRANADWHCDDCMEFQELPF